MKRVIQLALLVALFGGNSSANLSTGPPPRVSQISYKDKLSAKFGRKPIVAVMLSFATRCRFR
jgi:hypothetical protein